MDKYEQKRKAKLEAEALHIEESKRYLDEIAESEEVKVENLEGQEVEA